MTVSYESRSSRDEYYDWIAGRGPHKVTLITNRVFKLSPGDSMELLGITGREGDLRYLLIEINSATSSDNVRLVIETDSFYYNFTMRELMNYNIDKFVTVLPSVLVADPTINKYVVIFKPHPPLHYVDRLSIKLVNEEASAVVQVKASYAYSEVIPDGY